MSIKTCKENGHKYDAIEHEICPYCPDKTVVLNTSSSSDNVDKTEVVSPDLDTIDKTEIVSDSSSHDQTKIHNPSTDENNLNNNAAGRKLVGWLVSFSWDHEGQDYQLREGKTTLGGGRQCDIIIPDKEVSSHHATILYRSSKFRIKDEFSTNGTFIDGVEIEEQLQLEDGNIITLGKTEFKFRSI